MPPVWVRGRQFGLSGRARNLVPHDINRIRFPADGTASYTAISSYPGSSPANAADGQTGSDGVEWIPNGHADGEWWRVDWTAPQVLERVVLRDRLNTIDKWNSGYLVFSDGSVVTHSALPDDGSPLTVLFPEKAGVRWMRVQSGGTSGSNPGLAEVEAY